MIKKILVLLLILATATAVAANLLARKAPDFMRSAIERAVKKPVRIGAINYRFPGSFEVTDFQILERAPFEGETAFQADRIWFDVSPLTLSKKELIVDRIRVSDATIVLRKYKEKMYHPFSEAAGSKKEESSAPASEDASKLSSGGALPLSIRTFKLTSGHFKFIDYDVDPNGFVIALDEIEGSVRGISVPISSRNTTYSVRAIMPQGRDQRPAELRVDGWSQFQAYDTDARLDVKGLYLPYFRPYYAQVTPATITEGYLSSRAIVQILKKKMTANVDFEILQLFFDTYEEGDALFGLKAEEVLAFLKDSSGKLKFQIDVEWDMANRSRLRDVIRRSIEKSLKRTIVGSLGKFLTQSLQKTLETGNANDAKGDAKDKLEKVKDLFRF